MLVLWLEKLNQIVSFCNIGIMYAWGGPRSIKRGDKWVKALKKDCFSLRWVSPNQEFLKRASPNREFQKWAGSFQEFLKWASPNQEFLRWAEEWYQQMALIVAVWKAIRLRFNLHWKCKKFSYAIKNSWIQTSTRKNIDTGTIILANRWRRVYFREFLIWDGPFEEFLKRAGSFREFLIWAGQMAERPETNRFFRGFYPVLFSFFLSPDILYGHDTDILKRNWTWLAFSGSTGNWNKNPPLHRGCHNK